MNIEATTLITPNELAGSPVFTPDDNGSLRVNYSFYEAEQVTNVRGTVIDHGDFGVFEDVERTWLDVFEKICEHRRVFRIAETPTGPLCNVFAVPFSLAIRSSKDFQETVTDFLHKIGRAFPGQLV